MPVLSGIAGAGSAAAHYGLATTDGINLWGNLFVNARDNMANQEFNRQLASIDYKIQRQQLNREDIRDLVQLTASRMDIYHLVGTLMLAFCMTWYTDNTVADAPFEAWFTDLFLISNFSAVGFLLLCVWLAMYASLASRSIGTRLLTSYARLSFPSKDQLSKIDVPLFFPSAREAMRKQFQRASSSTMAHMKRSNAESSIRREKSLPAEEDETKIPDGGEEVESEDFQQHFRRFLEELPRWLVYDTWARACMSFGINQMLRALSYFSLGMLWGKSPAVAVMSIMAIRVLSVIVMWLDYGDLHMSWVDYLSIGCLNVLPPMLAVILIVCQASDVFIDLELNEVISAVLVMIVFGAHAGWLWYLVDFLPSAPRPGSANLHGRFHPGNFAHVLEWVQPLEDEAHVTTADSQTSFTARVDEWKTQDARGRCVTRDDGERFFTEEVERDNTRLFGEELAESRSSNYEVNGGHTPGKWMIPVVDQPTDAFMGDLDQSPSTDWLPVRMTRFFTYATMAWYIFSGVLHSSLIITDSYDSYGTKKTATFSPYSRSPNTLLQLPLTASLEANTLVIRWPEPAGFFKVESLHCSGSHLWVSDKFSLYSVTSSVGSNLTGALELVHEGSVGTVICGARRCHTVSRSAQGGATPWSMDVLQLASKQTTHRGTALHLWRKLSAAMHRHHRVNTSVQFPLPSSWRLLSGVWQDCRTDEAECDSLLFAGWDGATIAVSTLHKDEDTSDWSMHTRFEIEPSTGHCPLGSPRCTEYGPQTYHEVESVQLSNDGLALIALLPGGFVDIWDLSKGVLQERLSLHSNYTSMCLNGRGLLLSREGSETPIVVRTPGLASLNTMMPAVPERRHPEELHNTSPTKKRARLRQTHLDTDIATAVSMMQVSSDIRSRGCSSHST